MSRAKSRAGHAVAFQGARGAFSEEAARKLLGENVEVLPCERFEDVFRSLKEGRAEGAVVPIENTLAGSVHENYDHLQNFELPIVAETSVRIVHNLIAPKGCAFSEIKRVFSHPVALNQCLDFFARNPQIERIPFYDTAGSVKMIMEEAAYGCRARSPRRWPRKFTADEFSENRSQPVQHVGDVAAHVEADPVRTGFQPPAEQRAQLRHLRLQRALAHPPVPVEP